MELVIGKGSNNDGISSKQKRIKGLNNHGQLNQKNGKDYSKHA